MILVDLLIVGAGPAGMAAAVAARGHGLAVLVLDENPAPGGQVHRAIERRPPKDAADEDGRRLVAAFRACGAAYRAGATLWAIEPGGRAVFSEDGIAHSVTAGRILLCAGATERPLPVPGWTLPGVMTVGAAQVALKTSGLVPEGRTWLAGQGPLLWLYATQALAAGGRIAGIVDLSPGVPPAALRHLPRALRAPGDIARGLGWQRAVRRAGIRVLRPQEIRAEGDGRLERLLLDGEAHAADLLLLHDGVVPNTQVTRALPGCAHDWDPAQACWRPRLDAWGHTTVAGVMVAGDGGGVAGARAAVETGRIAALAAAHALGRLPEADRDGAAAPCRRRLSRALALRPLLEALHPPRPAAGIPDETILCRCEEVTAGALREAVTLGCLGANQAKAFTRVGMGPCQGRICGPAVTAVIAEARRVGGAEVEPFRTRFPTRPVTLGEIAALAE